MEIETISCPTKINRFFLLLFWNPRDKISTLFLVPIEKKFRMKQQYISKTERTNKIQVSQIYEDLKHSGPVQFNVSNFFETKTKPTLTSVIWSANIKIS